MEECGRWGWLDQHRLLCRAWPSSSASSLLQVLKETYPNKIRDGAKAVNVRWRLGDTQAWTTISTTAKRKIYKKGTGRRKTGIAVIRKVNYI